MKSKTLWPRILLMAASAEGSIIEGDVLDTDLGGVDTSFPLLKDGLYDMIVDSVVKERNKADDGDRLTIKVKTQQPAESQKGEALHPGFTLTAYIGITETEKYDKGAIKRSLATFRQAMGLKEGAFNPIEQYQGKVIRVKISTRPAKGEFEAANNVKFVPVE